VAWGNDEGGRLAQTINAEAILGAAYRFCVRGFRVNFTAIVCQKESYETRLFFKGSTVSAHILDVPQTWTFGPPSTPIVSESNKPAFFCRSFPWATASG
jgi:hypothetical protein